MRRYDAIIFDLDGTLLNTLDDLADSVNYALEKNGLPCRTIHEVRRFVGNGVARLMALAVPSGVEKNLERKCLKDFQGHYLTNMRNKTAPYPGILALLRSLKAKGFHMAVASNKFEGAVKELCPEYFENLLETTVGESPKTPKKPAPDMVFQAMAELGVVAERTVYVGDSEVDVETARNAGLDCIAVTWGFRDREFLLERGATVFAESVEALEALLVPCQI